jgi:hypothetical protein
LRALVERSAPAASVATAAAATLRDVATALADAAVRTAADTDRTDTAEAVDVAETRMEAVRCVETATDVAVSAPTADEINDALAALYDVARADAPAEV